MRLSIAMFFASDFLGVSSSAFALKLNSVTEKSFLVGCSQGDAACAWHVAQVIENQQVPPNHSNIRFLYRRHDV